MKKNFLLTGGDTTNFSTTQPIVTSTEALLRMADEGLANIEQELKQTQQKKAPLNKNASVSTLEKIRQMSKKGGDHQQQPKQEIQANFNLSFNNSFNTSYN